MAELAVPLEALHRVVHVAVRLVGVALLDERRDHRVDLFEVLGDLRLDVGLQTPEALHVLLEGFGEALAQRRGRLPVLLGARQDLVVDVGDVPDVLQRLPVVTQVPDQDVVHDVAAGMPQVRVVVDGRAAHIDARHARVLGREGFLFPAEGVVQAKHGGESDSGAREFNLTESNTRLDVGLSNLHLRSAKGGP